jgi:hypothetical protein
MSSVNDPFQLFNGLRIEEGPMLVPPMSPLRNQQILIKLSIQHPVKIKKQILIHHIRIE